MANYETQTDLLRRIGEHDEEAWKEFRDRYAGLIRSVARRRGLQDSDCDDALQNVMLALTRSMPAFQYDPAKGKFRSYLKTVVLRAISPKSCQGVTPVSLEHYDAAVGDAAFEDVWEQQWREYHLQRAMLTIESEFNEADQRAFQLYAREGRDASATAAELNMSVDQVYQAKSRIARRLAVVIGEQVHEEG